jgi:hypothetical protein
MMFKMNDRAVEVTGVRLNPENFLVAYKNSC